MLVTVLIILASLSVIGFVLLAQEITDYLSESIWRLRNWPKHKRNGFNWDGTRRDQS